MFVSPAADPPWTRLSRHLSAIIEGFRRTAAHHAGLNRALSPLVLILYYRLGRMAARFDALALKAKARTSETPPTPAGRAEHAIAPPPKLPRTPTPKPETPATPRRPSLPGGFARAVHRIPDTAIYGWNLQVWLTDPELPALLAAEPRLGRILRPLCQMLGIKPGPAALPSRRRRLRRAKPTRAKAKARIPARAVSMRHRARHAPPQQPLGGYLHPDEWLVSRKRR